MVFVVVCEGSASSRSYRRVLSLTGDFQVMFQETLCICKVNTTMFVFEWIKCRILLLGFLWFQINLVTPTKWTGTRRAS